MAVAVGGTGGLIDLLLVLVDWRATAVVADQERKDALSALNFAEQLVAQSESLMYLQERRTLALPNNQAYIAVPDDIDYGKDLYFAPSSGEGNIEYRPWDKFLAIRTSSGYAITATPVYFTIGVDETSGDQRFWFKPGNTSGASVNLILVGQVIPPALADTVGSFSTLPAGYEETILLPVAEEYIKSKRHEFGLESVSAETRSRIAELYQKQRANKEKPFTDRGRERRKVDVTVADEAY